MSSDPILDPSLTFMAPEPPPNPFLDLPPRNPERALALLTWGKSQASSAVQGFAGAGSGTAGLAAAALAPLVPMLIDQAAAALRGLDAETIDGALLNVAELLLAARSADAGVRAELVMYEISDETPATSAERPAHNED